MTQVVLGLGSNRSFNNKTPVELLALAQVQLEKILKSFVSSSVYKSKAMYVTDQDDFYNMVVSGKYEGNAFELLDKIHEIEAFLGRDRGKEFRNGPRPLDIDIELFGNEKIQAVDLVVPHERLNERAFVLMPLLEVLRENADEINIEGFTEKTVEVKLEGVKDQELELFMPYSDFEKIKAINP